MIPILKHINLAYTPPFCDSEIHFNVIKRARIFQGYWIRTGKMLVLPPTAKEA